jgi:hypothetical protein
MKQTLLGLGGLALVALVAAGCKNGNGKGMPDMSNSHEQVGCANAMDCDDGLKCHTWKCNTVTHMCDYKENPCPSDDCNMGKCDEAHGAVCGTVPTNEGGACMTMMGMAGSCTSGTCEPLPTCYTLDPFGDGPSLYCDSGSLAWAEDSNDPAHSSSTPTNNINGYSCAPNEGAPELAYKLSLPSGGDTDVTVSLVAIADPESDAGVVDKDLDLIILEGSCDAMAKCMNPALPGGGFQGITSGTAKERVSFHADASKVYYIVVDGKDAGQMTKYHVQVDACGACQPTPATTLACNMSMAISGDTSLGKSGLTTYMCGPGTTTTTVTAAGNEQSFFFRTEANADQTVRATITNGSQPFTALALPTNFNGACDPTKCLASVNSTGAPGSASATLSFIASLDFGGAQSYWVVVDTPGTANTTFGMTFDCLPYCNSAYSFDCGSTRNVPSGTNNGGDGSTNLTSKWGPGATGCSGRSDLTGPEYAVAFQTPAITTTKTYRFELDAQTSGQDLTLVILDAGKGSTASSCGPGLACATTTPILNGGASTGTYTTNSATGKTATVDLTTDANHNYWLVVDGPNGAVSDFALTVAGATAAALCP